MPRGSSAERFDPTEAAAAFDAALPEAFAEADALKKTYGKKWQEHFLPEEAEEVEGEEDTETEEAVPDSGPRESQRGSKLRPPNPKASSAYEKRETEGTESPESIIDPDDPIPEDVADAFETWRKQDAEAKVAAEKAARLARREQRKRDATAKIVAERAVEKQAVESLERLEKQEKEARLVARVKKVLTKTRIAYPGYLERRFDLSYSQANQVLGTLRDQGFLRETEEGELHIFPEGMSGPSYPVILAEVSEEVEQRRGHLADVPRAETPSFDEKDLVTLTGDTRGTAPRAPAPPPDIQVFPPKPGAYVEPDVLLAPAPPKPRKRRDPNEPLTTPKPPLREWLDERTLRREPPPAEVVVRAQQKVRDLLAPFDIEADYEDDTVLPEGTGMDDVAEGEEDADRVTPPPESGERVKVSAKEAAARLAELERMRTFGPRGGKYDAHQEALAARVETVRQMMERSEAEEEQKMAHGHVEAAAKAMADVLPKLAEAGAQFQEMQKAVTEKQEEAVTARAFLRELLGEKTPFPTVKAFPGQIEAWKKERDALASDDPKQKILNDLVAAAELTFGAETNLAAAQGVFASIQGRRDALTAERTALQETRRRAEAQERSATARITALDVAIGAATLAGLTAEFGPKISVKPEDVVAAEAEMKAKEDARERTTWEKVKERTGKAAGTVSEVTAPLHAPMKWAGKWGLWGGVAVTMIGVPLWLASNALRFVSQAVFHPIKSAQWLWAQVNKFADGGGGASKAAGK